MLQYAFKSKKVIYYPHVAISLKKNCAFKKNCSKPFYVERGPSFGKEFLIT